MNFIFYFIYVSDVSVSKNYNTQESEDIMAPQISLKQFETSTLKQRYKAAAEMFVDRLQTEENDKLKKMDPESRKEYIKGAKENAARFYSGTIFDDIYKQYE